MKAIKARALIDGNGGVIALGKAFQQDMVDCDLATTANGDMGVPEAFCPAPADEACAPS